MDTVNLETYMKEDKWISKYYGGVLPKDMLPMMNGKPKFYITNQDTSDKPGASVERPTDI